MRKFHNLSFLAFSTLQSLRDVAPPVQRLERQASPLPPPPRFPGLCIFLPDDSSCVRLKLCCTAAPRLMLSSLDGTSSAHLKLCYTAVIRLLIFFLPRWHQKRAPEVMLYRSTQATDIFLRRWRLLRAPEVMLYPGP